MYCSKGKESRTLTAPGAFEAAGPAIMARESKALLIGENSQGSSHLARILESHGCACQFASSYQQAVALLDLQCFDLVLGPLELKGVSVFTLVAMLEGLPLTLFYFQPDDDDCWWVPALRVGRKCLGSSALRPSELAVALRTILGEIAARPQELPAVRPSFSSPQPGAALPWSVAAPGPQRTVAVQGAGLAGRTAPG